MCSTREGPAMLTGRLERGFITRSVRTGFRRRSFHIFCARRQKKRKGSRHVSLNLSNARKYQYSNAQITAQRNKLRNVNARLRNVNARSVHLGDASQRHPGPSLPSVLQHRARQHSAAPRLAQTRHAHGAQAGRAPSMESPQ
jgi:hypothetical protein